MIKKIYNLPSTGCITEMGFNVWHRQRNTSKKYTMRDVHDLVAESLFHRWECGTLAVQKWIAIYVIGLCACIRRENMSATLAAEFVKVCMLAGIGHPFKNFKKA